MNSTGKKKNENKQTILGRGAGLGSGEECRTSGQIYSVTRRTCARCTSSVNIINQTHTTPHHAHTKKIHIGTIHQQNKERSVLKKKKFRINVTNAFQSIAGVEGSAGARPALSVGCLGAR
jgi:hypothetical protein